MWVKLAKSLDITCMQLAFFLRITDYKELIHEICNGCISYITNQSHETDISNNTQYLVTEVNGYLSPIGK